MGVYSLCESAVLPTFADAIALAVVSKHENKRALKIQNTKWWQEIQFVEFSARRSSRNAALQPWHCHCACKGDSTSVLLTELRSRSTGFTVVMAHGHRYGFQYFCQWHAFSEIIAVVRRSTCQRFRGGIRILVCGWHYFNNH